MLAVTCALEYTGLVVSTRFLHRLLLSALLTSALPVPALGGVPGAEAAPEGEPLSEREAYELDLIARAFTAAGLVPDPEPSGKIIERVVIDRHPIIEASDPWPDFLNVFHITTREHIVAQELLFAEGETYDEDKVRESARNLRGLPMLFSTVRIVTARGSTPDRVVVLVITKDLWSIRLNTNWNVGGGTFNFVSIMPTEQNFLGFNQQLSLFTQIKPDTYSLGEIYRVPRVLGSRWSFVEGLALVMNHKTGEEEGGFGWFTLSRPLVTLDTRWGYSLSGSFDIGVNRTYSGKNVRLLYDSDGDGSADSLQDKYEYRSFRGSAQLVRSFGTRWKTNAYLGYRVRYEHYGPTGDFPDVPDEIRRLFLQGYVPQDDEAGEIFFKLSFYEATYHRFQNIQTYGLTEDFRFGPLISAEVAHASPLLGFDQLSVRLRGQVSYRFLIGGDILSLGGVVAARWRPDHPLEAAEDENWINRWYEVELENVSPSLFGLGRLLVRLHYAHSEHSLDRTLLSLGGDKTLRGFPTGAQLGSRLFNVNAELRTAPWVIRTLHVGLVAFYDGGDAWGEGGDPDFAYHHSVGLGVRGLFPQFDRGVVRLDVGFPLGDDFDAKAYDSWFTFSFLQAF